MMRQLNRFWLFIIGFWRPAIQRAAPRKPPVRQNELYRFRGVILDWLDEYFVILKRMKRHDRDAYDLYSQRGGFIVSETWAIENPYGHEKYRKLSGWWKDNLPSFGAFFFSQNSGRSKDFFSPSFMYFQKYKAHQAPLCLERVSDGEVYVVTTYWDGTDDGDFKRSLPKAAKIRSCDFGVHVSKDGELRILKTFLPGKQEIRVKRRSQTHSRGNVFSVPNSKWGLHPFFDDWANDHNMEAKNYLISHFCSVASMYSEHHSEALKIRVRKGNLTAVFSIDMLKTPYFFKDREYCVTPSGKRKPIFHIVRAHQRVLGGGEVRYIKTHFRGHRKFVWNGYHIDISVPGWHGRDLAGFNVGAVDADELDSRAMLDMKKLGKFLDDIEARPGGESARRRLEA